MLEALPTLLLVMGSAGPSIASNSTCPSSRDIASHLSDIAALDGGQPGTVAVTGLPDRLLLELRPDDAGGGAQRSVAVDGDCDERAMAAAVVIAAWWPGEHSGPPDHQAQATSLPPLPRRWLWLSAAIFVAASADGAAPGARLELSARGRALGLRLALGGTAAQGGSLDRGHVDYWRANVELGPSYELGPLRLDAGVVAGLLAVRGSKFTQNQSSQGASGGGTAGLRVGWRLGRLIPWLEARGMVWPLSQRIYVVDTEGRESSRPLPHVELQLSIGAALSL